MIKVESSEINGESSNDQPIERLKIKRKKKEIISFEEADKPMFRDYRDELLED
jgi:hypothetical protein